MRTDMAVKIFSPESSDFESDRNQNGGSPPRGFIQSLSLFGGAICWTIHFVFVALAAEWGCVSGMGQWRFLGGTGIAWAVIVASLVALAATGWATRLSWRSFRQQCETGSGDLDNRRPDDGRRSGCYLAQVAVWSNGLFLLVIVAQTIPILFYWTTC
jgi:hypothetical protein